MLRVPPTRIPTLARPCALATLDTTRTALDHVCCVLPDFSVIPRSKPVQQGRTVLRVRLHAHPVALGRTVGPPLPWHARHVVQGLTAPVHRLYAQLAGQENTVQQKVHKTKIHVCRANREVILLSLAPLHALCVRLGLRQIRSVPRERVAAVRRIILHLPLDPLHVLHAQFRHVVLDSILPHAHSPPTPCVYPAASLPGAHTSPATNALRQMARLRVLVVQDINCFRGCVNHVPRVRSKQTAILLPAFHGL